MLLSNVTCYPGLSADIEQAKCKGELIGVIIGKQEDHRGVLRGYIAMLAVREDHRGKGLGAKDLVLGCWLVLTERSY